MPNTFIAIFIYEIVEKSSNINLKIMLINRANSKKI